MATRTSVGAVTIADIKDGINPISMVLSNQSHTFAANSSGTVVAAEQNKFVCEVFVYVGATRATYSPTLAANNTYSVGVTDPSGWATTTAVVANQLRISVSTIPSGTTNNTGVVDLLITVKNSIGNDTVINASISLAKAIEGAGGAIITLTPNRQTFRFLEDGTTADGDITMTIATQGNVGSLSAQKSINGAAYTTLTQGTGSGLAKTLDIDGLGSNDNVVISAANFSTYGTLSIRITGTGTSDTVSLIRIENGKTGAASLLVTISSDVGGFQFKNNAGANKTLTAKVYDMADGSLITAGGGTTITYQWYVDGAIQAGKTSSTILVSATDIPDNGSELYSCNVTVTEA